MGRLLLATVLATSVWVLADRRRRDEAAEIARDLSDALIALTLRATSGFAADVPMPLQAEERERRVRWQ